MDQPDHLVYVGNHCSRQLLKIPQYTHLLVLSYAAPLMYALMQSKHLGLVDVHHTNIATLTTTLLNHFYLKLTVLYIQIYTLIFSDIIFAYRKFINFCTNAELGAVCKAIRHTYIQTLTT